MLHEVIQGRFEHLAGDLPADALVIADPPWGKSYVSNHNTGYRAPRGAWDAATRDNNFEPIEGDDEPFDPTPLLRFAKIVTFGANYYCHLLPPSPCWIVWDKKLGKPDHAADCELAWTNLQKQSRIFSHLWRGICRAGECNVRNSAKLHPNQKPPELMRRIIQYAEHDGLVIDAYCGSGATACAAKDLGLDCVSIDLGRHWCDLTRKRVATRVDQSRLRF